MNKAQKIVLIIVVYVVQFLFFMFTPQSLVLFVIALIVIAWHDSK